MLFSVTEGSFPCLGKVGMGSVPQGFYVVVILNSGAKHSVIQNPCNPCQCVTPDLIRYPLLVQHHRHSVLDTESPTSSEGVKTIFTLCKVSNYAIPGRSPE